MPSQLRKIQERLAVLQSRADLMKPSPVECDELLVELDSIGDLAAQEADFIFDLIDRTGALLQRAQKVVRLAGLVAMPLLTAMILAVALGLTAMTVMNESWPFALFALLAACNAGLIIVADRQLRPTVKPSADEGETDEVEASVVQTYADLLDEKSAVVEKYAKQFDDAAQRRQLCDRPWNAAVGLLAVELAVCIACGHAVLFFEAFLYTVFGLLVAGGAACAIDAGEDGTPLGLEGLFDAAPADANLLEKAVFLACRSPLLPSAGTALAVHIGFPLANSHVLTPQAAKMAARRLRRAREVAADARAAKNRVVANLRKAIKPAAEVEQGVRGVVDAVKSGSVERTVQQAGAALQSMTKSEAAPKVVQQVQQTAQQTAQQVGATLQAVTKSAPKEVQQVQQTAQQVGATLQAVTKSAPKEVQQVQQTAQQVGATLQAVTKSRDAQQVASQAAGLIGGLLGGRPRR